MRKLTSRLPLMAASLVLAFLLWILVIAEEKIEAGFMVPLVFDSIPASVVIDGSPATSVYVQVRGSKRAVASILPQQIRAHVDLSSARPGNEFIQISPQDIVFPTGIIVLGVYPPYLDLKFLAKKPVPVRARLIGKPSEGYELVSVTVMPREIELVGPPRRINTITEVRTYPVDIGGRKEGLKTRVELVQPGDDIRLMQLKPMEVVVEIAAKMVKKTFDKVPVAGGNGNVKIAPTTVSVVVEGAYQNIGQLSKEEIVVRVDWDSQGPDPAVRPLRTSVPAGFKVLSCEPGTVRIK